MHVDCYLTRDSELRFVPRTWPAKDTFTMPFPKREAQKRNPEPWRDGRVHVASPGQRSVGVSRLRTTVVGRAAVP